jgi:glycosyltransferase involved in cell wall biosynthesis
MKVLYDHQSFTGLSYGGVSRYFFELMRSFAKREDVEFELSLRLSNNEYLDQESFSNHLRYRSLAQFHTVHRVASVLNRIHSLRRLKAGQFDVFHPTYYHRYFLNSLGQKPFVLTFHDAASERFGDIYPDLGEGLYEVKKKLIKRADAVICVSEFSRQEILRYFTINPEKVSVVHLGTAFGLESDSAIRKCASESLHACRRKKNLLTSRLLTGCIGLSPVTRVRRENENIGSTPIQIG